MRVILFLSVTIVLSGMFLLSQTSVSYANKNSVIKNEIATKKAAHAALLKKSKVLDSEVTTLKSNLVKISGKLRTSEKRLSTTDQRLKNLRQKKANTLKNLYKDQQAMGGLVSAVRKYSQTSTANMLAQATPIDAARAFVVMKSIMPRLQQHSILLQEQLLEIRGIEGDISDQIQIQTQQNKNLNKQQKNLSSILKKRKKLYKSTENKRQVRQKEVNKLIKESKNIEELISKLKPILKKRTEKKALRASLPSNLLLPVHGTVYTEFGKKDDLGAKSKGITFITRPGAGVVVPLAGIVKFAGTFQKYRQILIVEHQGGYHSLIAGLAHIDAVIGASLVAGEPVGVAEDSNSPQIYYELRQNGKPVNPKKLLIAQRKQGKS
ncbi:MAG: peptidoglycan DD-metalloendopeptidase family protein [Alphaproteobacteria bacterium]|nr:peptidoglycan DD-metalloendopeptidase family protein [Alphaproteobacteria bacterium]